MHTYKQNSIPYIQISRPSKIIDTSENILDSFETTLSLSTQMIFIETLKRQRTLALTVMK